MKALTIGIVDYGIGNHASVSHALHDLGFRVRVSADPAVLDAADALLLPGVGAFRTAMQALEKHGLVEYLQFADDRQRPIIGICLGMQLLTTASHERGYTKGLNLVPGEVERLGAGKWHIGWNSLDCISSDPLISASNGASFYFNHSLGYQGDDRYRLAVAQHDEPVCAAIRKGKTIGLQFHPEKSQLPGRLLLKTLIDGLCDA